MNNYTNIDVSAYCKAYQKTRTDFKGDDVIKVFDSDDLKVVVQADGTSSSIGRVAAAFMAHYIHQYFKEHELYQNNFDKQFGDNAIEHAAQKLVAYTNDIKNDVNVWNEFEDSTNAVVAGIKAEIESKKKEITEYKNEIAKKQQELGYDPITKKEMITILASHNNPINCSIDEVNNTLEKEIKRLEDEKSKLEWNKSYLENDKRTLENEKIYLLSDKKYLTSLSDQRLFTIIKYPDHQNPFKAKDKISVEFQTSLTKFYSNLCTKFEKIKTSIKEKKANGNRQESDNSVPVTKIENGKEFLLPQQKIDQEKNKKKDWFRKKVDRASKPKKQPNLSVEKRNNNIIKQKEFEEIQKKLKNSEEWISFMSKKEAYLKYLEPIIVEVRNNILEIDKQIEDKKRKIDSTKRKLSPKIKTLESENSINILKRLWKEWVKFWDFTNSFDKEKNVETFAEKIEENITNEINILGRNKSATIQEVQSLNSQIAKIKTFQENSIKILLNENTGYEIPLVLNDDEEFKEKYAKARESFRTLFSEELKTVLKSSVTSEENLHSLLYRLTEKIVITAVNEEPISFITMLCMAVVEPKRDDYHIHIFASGDSEVLYLASNISELPIQIYNIYKTEEIRKRHINNIEGVKGELHYGHHILKSGKIVAIASDGGNMAFHNRKDAPFMPFLKVLHKAYPFRDAAETWYDYLKQRNAITDDYSLVLLRLN